MFYDYKFIAVVRKIIREFALGNVEHDQSGTRFLKLYVDISLDQGWGTCGLKATCGLLGP
jgi:hypothetical protein